MNMKQLRDQIHLVAGKNGIDRRIRWVYFADCVQCLEEDFDLSELIHGGEFVIVTNEGLTANDDRILDMIRVMSEKNIAAFAINEGQISQAVIDYCDEIELPLYELPIRLHLIDLSQVVCRALVEEEMNTNSRERLLSSILYTNHIEPKELLEQANYVGVNLSGEQQILVFRIEEVEETKERQKSEIDPMESLEYIKKTVEGVFRSYGIKRAITLSQPGRVVLLLPAEFFSRDLLLVVLKKIIQKVEQRWPVFVKVGIGTPYEYIEDFKRSFQEAKDALEISKILPEEKRIYFYQELGVYSLITQVSNGRFLDDYVENRIGKLVRADNMQEGELYRTLEAYLDHNCNMNATAEALFIHRNTMRYRMEKIKKILGNNLDDMSIFLELKLAFAIKKYRSK